MRVVATEKTFTQGSAQQTGNALDVLIQGRGFFQVLQPDGNLAYSRDGSFKIDSEGRLVTASGYEIQPSLTIPSDAQSITIGLDGTVEATLPGQTSPTSLGTLQLADFINPAGLQPKGQNLLPGNRRQRLAPGGQSRASRASARWCRARSRAPT